MGLQELYDAYCDGGNCRDQLMLCVREACESTLMRRLARKRKHLATETITEITDDAFVRVMRRLDRLEPIDYVQGIVHWHIRTVYRKYLTDLRRMRQNIEYDTDMPDPLSFDMPYPSPYIHTDTHEYCSVFDTDDAGSLWKPETMMTVARAARELDVSRAQGYLLVKGGKLKSKKHCGRLVVTVRDLRDFVLERELEGVI